MPTKSALRNSLCGLFVLVLAACTTTPPQKPEVKTVTEVRFEKADFSRFSEIPGSDWNQALLSFRQSCRAQAKKPLWSSVCRSAATASSGEDFFRSNFVPWKMEKVTLAKESGEILQRDEAGLMTGYYEPFLMARSTGSKEYHIPILSTPDDLIIVDLASIYPKLKGMRLRGKLVGRKLVPYDDRAGIEKRKDLDRYAIAWSNDPVGVFFLQIQGSGRLELEDGTIVRVGYADQNGHPYKAVGSWLVQKGYLKRHELSMQSIKKWAVTHPNQVDELLNQNPSFVFFKVRNDLNPNDGPVGAQGVPLTPMASVAVDRRKVPLGTPLVVQADQSNPEMHFMRPVVAQDTGGAISGPLRFDFFWGPGDEAGNNAGRQKSDARAWLLLPKGVNPSELK